jgi:hypothetical protein
MNWTDDYEKILESLRLNAVYMSRSHKKKYFRFKQMSNYFRVPTIILICFGFRRIGRSSSLYQSAAYQRHHLSCNYGDWDLKQYRVIFEVTRGD